MTHLFMFIGTSQYYGKIKSFCKYSIADNEVLMYLNESNTQSMIVLFKLVQSALSNTKHSESCFNPIVMDCDTKNNWRCRVKEFSSNNLMELSFGLKALEEGQEQYGTDRKRTHKHNNQYSKFKTAGYVQLKCKPWYDRRKNRNKKKKCMLVTSKFDSLVCNESDSKSYTAKVAQHAPTNIAPESLLQEVKTNTKNEFANWNASLQVSRLFCTEEAVNPTEQSLQPTTKDFPPGPIKKCSLMKVKMVGSKNDKLNDEYTTFSRQNRLQYMHHRPHCSTKSEAENVLTYWDLPNIFDCRNDFEDICRSIDPKKQKLLDTLLFLLYIPLNMLAHFFSFLFNALK